MNFEVLISTGVLHIEQMSFYKMCCSVFWCDLKILINVCDNYVIILSKLHNSGDSSKVSNEIMLEVNTL